MQKLVTLVSFFVLFLNCAVGQNTGIYNINKNNGLFTNHVYLTQTDKWGYLWIGTDKGVYRYNGYTLKRYEYKDGLTNMDVWNFYQDSQDRIWLINVSNQLGYIKNGRYENFYINKSSTASEIYPFHITKYNDMYIMTNKATDDSNCVSTYILRNDTLVHKNIYKSPKSVKTAGGHLTDSFFVDTQIDGAYFIEIEKWLAQKGDSINQYHFKARDNKELTTNLVLSNVIGTFKRFVYYASSKEQVFNFYDFKAGILKTIALNDTINNKKEEFVHAYNIFAHNNDLANTFHILTTKNVYVLDSNANIKKVCNLNTYFNRGFSENNYNTYFFQNSFWGDILSTNNSGFYLNLSNNIFFRKSDIDLKGYNYVGGDDSFGYWWNTANSKLLQVKNGKAQKSHEFNGGSEVKKAMGLPGSNTLLYGHGYFMWLKSDGTFANMMTNITSSPSNITELSRDSIYRSLPLHCRDIVIADTNTYYFAHTYSGTSKLTIKNGRPYYSPISHDRYQKLFYNKETKLLIAYSKDKLLLVDTKSNAKYELDQKQLANLGVNGIENIISDDYGNIYVKDFDKITAYNIYLNKGKRLYRNFILEDAIMNIYQSKLCIAGKFGVLETNITGPMKFSGQQIYPNTKNIYYNFITDVQYIAGDILLNTDKGSYVIDKKSATTINNRADSFNIILQADSIFVKLNNNDTIEFSQLTTFADIDIIKPTGTGALKITYSINGTEYVNSGYQLIFPKLPPNSYNIVSLVAYDDSWRSQPVIFYVYIRPYWWQTNTATIAFITVLIIILTTIIYLSVIATKKIANRNNDRRNQRRELELKSIYSQINPHFIFNSLSTAQYFVKKNKNKEAYEHINQFSDLLRSYIKSSRDKYITIADELQNLENYLQLQLTRFENKFEYQFKIDSSVNPSSVKIPSLLLQPLVENALNHGIFHNDKKGLLIVSFKADNACNELTCRIDDNGIGRHRSKKLRSEIIRKADSYGNILIKELIDTFNKYETIKIDLEYIDKVIPETGTTVIIKIKNYTNVQ